MKKKCLPQDRSRAMRPAFSLIELVFSMVVIALIFTVVPKILFVSTKSMQLQIKEDGLYSVISMMGQILKVSWDQKTIDTNGAILGSSEINCTNEKPRNDANNPLIGQRICSNTAPDNSQDSGCDDIDDFRDGGSCRDANTTGGRIAYNLSVAVVMNDANSSKELNATVTSDSKKLGAGFKKTFSYRSYNVGWARVEKKWVGP